MEINLQEAELILKHIHTDRRYYDEINDNIIALRSKLEKEINTEDLLRAVDYALDKYDAGTIDVENDDQVLYIAYSTIHESYPVSNKRWKLKDINEDLLVEELEKRNVGVNIW